MVMKACDRVGAAVDTLDRASEVLVRPVRPIGPTCPESLGLVGRPRCVWPSADLVREHAFELYEARCRAGVPGDAASDWAMAERDLTGASALISMGGRPERQARN